MNIICISGKAQHGKDTAAMMFMDELTACGKKVLLTHYADLLKWMCKNYFNWDGNKDDFGRTLLQRVGTDVIRQQQPDFWVNWVIELLKLFPDEWDYVIIPDCRFPNEIEAMQTAFSGNAGVFHFRIERPNFSSTLSEEQKQHISEVALDHYPFDRKIENTTLDDARAQVKAILKDHFYLELYHDNT